jgi:hypothetical protein
MHSCSQRPTPRRKHPCDACKAHPSYTHRLWSNLSRPRQDPAEMVQARIDHFRLARLVSRRPSGNHPHRLQRICHQAQCISPNPSKRGTCDIPANLPDRRYTSRLSTCIVPRDDMQPYRVAEQPLRTPRWSAIETPNPLDGTFPPDTAGRQRTNWSGYNPAGPRTLCQYNQGPMGIGGNSCTVFQLDSRHHTTCCYTRDRAHIRTILCRYVVLCRCRLGSAAMERIPWKIYMSRISGIRHSCILPMAYTAPHPDNEPFCPDPVVPF